VFLGAVRLPARGGGSSGIGTCGRRWPGRAAGQVWAGMLTAIRVPSEQEEAVRNLVRTRADLVDDRKRMMHCTGALPQQHGRVWRAPR
jgi:hypothetical protein